MKYSFPIEHKNAFGDITSISHIYEIEDTGCFFEWSLPPNLVDYNAPNFISEAAKRLEEHRKKLDAEWDEWKRNCRPPLVLTPIGQVPNFLDQL